MKNKIALSFATSLLLSGSIYAQDTTQELESITVTAQKTEENVQEVPIAMSVFDEFDMEDKRIKSIKDIAPYTSSLMFFDDANGAGFSPTIRGLKTDSGADSSSLAMYIDGVPMLGSIGFNAVFMDIERIEVLKGPQGTLYGKGAEAGVINIITKKSDNETKAKIGAEFGSDNKKEYSFGVSGPIVKDKLYIGVSGKHYEKDGMINNTYKGGQTDDREYNYGKVNLRYTPTDDLELSLISQLLQGDDGGVSWNPISATSRKNPSTVGISEPKTLLNAFRIKYNYDNYKFESITTHKKIEQRALRDFDFTSYDVYHMRQNNDRENFSQEFRLSAKYDNFNWLMGLNADKEEVKMDAGVSSIYPSFSSVHKSDYEADSYGIFAHAEYALADNLFLLGGLRYDKNNIEYKEEGSTTTVTNSFSEVSPKIGLEYKLNKNSMLYSTIAKGYKPGGIYTYAAQGYPKAYNKETLWAYEIGSKNSFLDNTLVLNAAVYYMEVDDMQVTAYTSTTGSHEYKSNAAEATSKGFEFDLSYKVNNNLKVFTSFGYNKTKFDNYKDERGDYSGNTNHMAPKYNYNVGALYRTDNGFYASADVNGYGDMWLNRENDFKRDAFNLVNTKVGYESENYDIYLYADNLFDKEYDSKGIYNGSYVIYSEPREIGIQLAYRF